VLHGVGCDVIWELVSSDVELVSSEMDLNTHFQLNALSRCINTRWFKYDRDWLCVNKSQFVPVIFEPPCICASVAVLSALNKTIAVFSDVTCNFIVLTA
jgi:hypothetical protein